MSVQKEQGPVLLIRTGHEPDLLERIREIAPGARVVLREDIEREPSLLADVEIVYGRVDPARLGEMPRLRWMQSSGAGVGWVQREEVRGHPVVVTNARFHDVQISEHLFGMLLMLVRKLHEAYRWQLNHEAKTPDWREIPSLPGRTLCILGPGVIGQRCARLGKAHGMRTTAVRRRPGEVPHVDEVFSADRLKEALAGADVVMNLLPGTRSTYRMIGAAEFATMPKGAFFLNAGRGSTVDTDAMVEALRSGQLGGVGLDVTDPEPLPPEHPLWDLPNAIVTRHYSGVVGSYDRQAGEIFLANLRRYVAGQPLQSVVDKEAGY